MGEGTAMKEPMRVLHVLGGVGLGGAESRIMDLYRCIDKEKLQFDFLVHQSGPGYYEEEIQELGGRIYRVPRFRLYNILTYRKALRAFFKEHHAFRAVHGHMTSTAAVYLPIAKKCGIPVTIAHARSAGVDKGMKGIVTRLLRIPLRKKCDYMFACSGLAAEAVFGKKNALAGKVTIVPNAIDAGAFRFCAETRAEMRRTLGIAEKFVIGHVGRFHYAKNHEYLLEVFAQIVKKHDNAILLLLGEGERKEEMQQKAAYLGIAEKVRFCGNQKETWKYYQAMDFFVFPSRFEGLPGTVVEAQSAGLRCLISDTIAKECIITELAASKSIAESPAAWAEYVLANREYERTDRYGQIRAAGFDVRRQAEWYGRFYRNGNADCGKDMGHK